MAKICEVTDAEYDGRVLRFDAAQRRSNDSSKSPRNAGNGASSAPSDTLFVGNLSFDCTEDTLYEVPTGKRRKTRKKKKRRRKRKLKV